MGDAQKRAWGGKPYNTGARDWTYNNRFVDENDSYRHSKWLSFMQPELTRHGRDVGTGPGQQAFKNPFHLLADRRCARCSFKSFVELWVQHFKQLGVGGERAAEIGRIEDEDIPARSEFDRAFEISFMDPGMACDRLRAHPYFTSDVYAAESLRSKAICQQTARLP